MLRVFIDLEMNMVSQKNTELRAVLPHEIIEIGAVKLDDNCRVADRFCALVRPRHNTTVHWTVQRLTGITAKQLREADYLEEVLPRFVEWIGDKESVFLYAWSDSDRAQVERECTYKQLWTPQLRAVCAHWTDFQRVFSRMVGYRNGLALSRAVEYMGLDFDGTKHDALSDAENCARLMALVLNEKEFARRKALVPPEPVPVRKPREAVEGNSAKSEKAPNPSKRNDKAAQDKKEKSSLQGRAAAQPNEANLSSQTGNTSGETGRAANAGAEKSQPEEKSAAQKKKSRPRRRSRKVPTEKVRAEASDLGKGTEEISAGTSFSAFEP